MKKFLRLFLQRSKSVVSLLICAAFAVACDDDPEIEAPQAKLSLSRDEVTYNYHGGNIVVFVESDSDWSMEYSGGDWLGVTRSDGAIQLFAGTNTTSESRSARIVVTAGAGALAARSEVSVTQSPMSDAVFTLKGNSVHITADGSAQQLEASCTIAYDVISTADWLTVEKSASGLTFTATANDTGSVRSTEVVLKAGTGNYPAQERIEVTQYTGAFIYTLTVPEAMAGTAISAPFAGTYDLTIDWGDGSKEHVAATNIYGGVRHTYENSGVYDVKVVGSTTDIYLMLNASDDMRQCYTAIKDWGNLGVQDMQYAFYRCVNLKSLPADGCKAFSACTSFESAFSGCTGLAEISPDLLKYATRATTLKYMFNGCSSLQFVPAALLANCTAVTNIYSLFNDCDLRVVPAGLFDYPQFANVDNAGLAFAYNRKLESVPDGLFKNFKSCTDLHGMFTNCYSLRSVPADLLENCVSNTTLASFFYGCQALEEVPEGLFDACAAVSGSGIGSMFFNCSSLRKVPADLFAKMTELTSLNFVFNQCISLVELPSSIFDNNRKATSCTRTFYLDERLAGESPYTMVGDEKVHLYERVDYPDHFAKLTTNKTFTGCVALDDYEYMKANYPSWVAE